MSAGGELAVAHLVWAPLGTEMLTGFLDSYRRVDAGAGHRLLVILNGFAPHAGEEIAGARDQLAAFEHEALVLERPTSDLAAYRAAALATDARVICFVNSYSRPLASGWLAKLAAPLADPAIGLAGASGSYESAFSAAPMWLKPARLRRFPPFPNAHVRSNGFAIERRLLLELDWSVSRSKRSAWALESGRRSITRQVLARGLRAVIVGRDAEAYEQPRWRESATFRSGSQANLLIADNRTEQYAHADTDLKRTLERMAWGSAETG